MQASSSFKLAFLKQMLLGFRLTAVSSKILNLKERKNAIKLSADIAMAASRGSTRWTHGLVANLAMDEKSKSLLKCILGSDQYERLMATKPRLHSSWKIPRCKKIIKRSFSYRVRSVRKKKSDIVRSSSILARSIVKKRTQVLKRLVPGGETMDGFSLLDETLDYVISLRAQVDLMRRLLKASEASKLKADARCTLQERKASLIGQ